MADSCSVQIEDNRDAIILSDRTGNLRYTSGNQLIYTLPLTLLGILHKQENTSDRESEDGTEGAYHSQLCEQCLEMGHPEFSGLVNSRSTQANILPTLPTSQPKRKRCECPDMSFIVIVLASLFVISIGCTLIIKFVWNKSTDC